MLNKIKKYNGINLLKKENFDEIYKKLKTGDFILLANNKKIISDESFYYSGIVYSYKSFFCWRYYGSSANKQTKKALKWILQNIFDDCADFALLDFKTYNFIIDQYLQKIFDERQTNFIKEL